MRCGNELNVVLVFNKIHPYNSVSFIPISCLSYGNNGGRYHLIVKYRIISVNRSKGAYNYTYTQCRGKLILSLMCIKSPFLPLTML